MSPSSGEPRVAAYFDFDRTVLDGDAGVLFGRELFHLKWRRVLDEAPGTVGWSARILRYWLHLLRLFLLTLFYRGLHRLFLIKRSALVRKAYTALQGWSLEDLAALAHDFFDEVLVQRIFPDARDAIERHHREGHRVIVVTTNMHLLVDHVKRHLPVDDVIAITLETRDGVVTGAVRGPLWGREKAEAVRAYAHAHDLSLPRSHAYSDHHSDRPFLQLVGHPVAVNPSLRLRIRAWDRGWRVERWKRPKRSG